MPVEKPIPLGDIRRASSVNVTLPLDPYWREEGEEFEELTPYPCLGAAPDMPYPSLVRLVRVTKVVATGLFCDCQCSAYLNIVGNTFDPFFFSSRSSGRNLYILRLHIRVTGRMGELSELRELERPVTENDIRKCSNVYLRVRMVKSTASPVAVVSYI